MTILDEIANAPNEWASTLASGLETISQNQTVVFNQYVKLVLPLDGYVFWVRVELLQPSALFNAGAFNAAAFNQNPSAEDLVEPLIVKGSLHYSTEKRQEESENFSTNRVIFTSESEIEPLNNIAPNTMWIGTFDNLKFAFSNRSSLYRQSNLFHYQGFAVYPAMESQIIDSTAAINTSNLIVSNSLPLWLTLDQFMPMYPSYLVPDNIAPPWCSVHIDPENTIALQAAPYIEPTTGSQWQLAQDRVTLTVYGLNNNAILDFMDYIFAYSLNTDEFGIMNMPIVQDEKRTQSELGILAIKKTIRFDINYYQSRIRQTALEYIKSAFIDLLLQ